MKPLTWSPTEETVSFKERTDGPSDGDGGREGGGLVAFTTSLQAE
jgi:hypothetical protein